LEDAQPIHNEKNEKIFSKENTKGVAGLLSVGKEVMDWI
jgi:hypothetical protein